MLRFQDRPIGTVMIGMSETGVVESGGREGVFAAGFKTHVIGTPRGQPTVDIQRPLPSDKTVQAVGIASIADKRFSNDPRDNRAFRYRRGRRLRIVDDLVLENHSRR